jgi:uncharacterized repeat protein (TIGR03943 family)
VTRSLLQLVALAVWAAFFFYLWLSGEMVRYLGPRTYWVVIFGAITLGLAAAVHAWMLRGAPPTRPSTRDLGAMLLMLVPMLAVAIVPSPGLGALAASRKATGVGAIGALTPQPDPGGQISFVEINFASESGEYAAKAGIAHGTNVQLVGFVTPTELSEADFDLTRFHVSCCAADAIPFSVPVTDGPSDLPVETWLRVEGVLERVGSRFVLAAKTVEEISEPKDPYLY